MAPELSRSDLVLVPLRAGSGTRVKILEAWAHGVPVVSTSIGAEGLNAIDGTHLLIAESPADFAECVRRLLRDDALRSKIVNAASRLYKAQYTASVMEQRVRRVCAPCSELTQVGRHRADVVGIADTFGWDPHCHRARSCTNGWFMMQGAAVRMMA